MLFLLSCLILPVWFGRFVFEHLRYKTTYRLFFFFLFRDLRGNSFRCDCKIKWLVDWMEKTNTSVPAIYCASPFEFQGRRIHDLAPRDFNCISAGFTLALFNSSASRHTSQVTSFNWISHPCSICKYTCSLHQLEKWTQPIFYTKEVRTYVEHLPNLQHSPHHSDLFRDNISQCL